MNMTVWDKVKLGARIVVIALCGTALVFGAREVLHLYEQFYEQDEAAQLLGSDLTVAKDYGKAASKKLAALNKKYDALLKKHNAKITAYAELTAKLEATREELRKVKSTIPKENPKEVPCPDGKCTKEICMPLFVGEEIAFDHIDQDISLNLNLKRLNSEQWDLAMKYRLHQIFRLSLIEVTHAETGKKSVQASLTQIDETGAVVRPLKITDFKYASEDNTKFGMQWWAPTLKLGLHQPAFSQSNWYPKPFLAVSFSKWTRPGHGDLWHFFQIGMGTGGRESPLLFLLTPASYNLGSKIPVIKDLWLGIDIGVDIKAKLTVGISISTSL